MKITLKIIKIFFINFILLCLSFSFVNSVDYELGDDGVTGPLRIVVSPNFNIDLYHSAYNSNLYYNTNSRYNVLNYDNISGSRLKHKSTSNMDLLSHSQNGNQITTVAKAQDLILTQVVTYQIGMSKYYMEFNILNNGTTNVSNIMFGTGGDTYFADSDSSRSYFNPTLGMIYLKNANAETSGIMGLYGVGSTPISGYYGGSYSESDNWLYNEGYGNFSNPSFVDAGYNVRWNNDSTLIPGDSWTIYAEEQVTGPDKIQVISPGRVSTFIKNEINYTFTILNFEDIDSNFNFLISSSNDWDISIDITSLFIASGSSAEVVVGITIPQNVSVNTTDILKLIAISDVSGNNNSNYVSTYYQVHDLSSLNYEFNFGNINLTLRKEPTTDVNVSFDNDLIFNFIENEFIFNTNNWNITQSLEFNIINNYNYSEDYFVHFSGKFFSSDDFYNYITFYGPQIQIIDDEIINNISNINIYTEGKLNDTFILNFSISNFLQNVSDVWVTHYFSGNGINSTYLSVDNYSKDVSFEFQILKTRGNIINYTIYSNDSYGNIFSSDFNFTVLNTKPTNTNLDNYIFNTSWNLDIEILCSDIDSDSLSYNVDSGLGSGANFDINTTSGVITLNSLDYKKVGDYSVNVSCSDSYGESSKIMNYTIVDLSGPNVTLDIVGNEYVTTTQSNISINFSIYDMSEVDSCVLNTNSRNDGSYINISNLNNISFFFNSDDLSYGQNIWNVYCVDEYNNSKVSKDFTIISNKGDDRVQNVNLVTGSVNKVDIPSNAVKLSIQVGTAGSINVTVYEFNPTPVSIINYSSDSNSSNSSSEKIKLVNNFVVIDADSSIHDNLSWAIIEFKLNESLLIEKNINISTLKVFYFNSSSNAWEVELNSGVNLDTLTLWANVSHFSLFGFGGFEFKDIFTIPTTPTTGDGGRSGGGGGGSSRSNVEVLLGLFSLEDKEFGFGFGDNDFNKKTRNKSINKTENKMGKMLSGQVLKERIDNFREPDKTESAKDDLLGYLKFIFLIVLSMVIVVYVAF